MQVQIVLYDGVDELDAVGPYEVFASAGVHGADVEVRYVLPSGAPRATLQYGTTVEATGPFFPATADVVLVPGGGWRRRAAVGAWAEVRRE